MKKIIAHTLLLFGLLSPASGLLADDSPFYQTKTDMYAKCGYFQECINNNPQKTIFAANMALVAGLKYLPDFLKQTNFKPHADRLGFFLLTTGVGISGIGTIAGKITASNTPEKYGCDIASRCVQNTILDYAFAWFLTSPFFIKQLTKMSWGGFDKLASSFLQFREKLCPRHLSTLLISIVALFELHNETFGSKRTYSDTYNDIKDILSASHAWSIQKYHDYLNTQSH